MKVQIINSQSFGISKQAALIRLAKKSKCTDLKVVKNYSQYLEVYGLTKNQNSKISNIVADTKTY